MLGLRYWGPRFLEAPTYYVLYFIHHILYIIYYTTIFRIPYWKLPNSVENPTSSVQRTSPAWSYLSQISLTQSFGFGSYALCLDPPNVPLLRALWSLLHVIRGVLKGNQLGLCWCLDSFEINSVQLVFSQLLPENLRTKRRSDACDDACCQSAQVQAADSSPG